MTAPPKTDPGSVLGGYYFPGEEHFIMTEPAEEIY